MNSSKQSVLPRVVLIPAATVSGAVGRSTDRVQTTNNNAYELLTREILCHSLFEGHFAAISFRFGPK